MELISPYAVMRNTATFKAYRAYSRKAGLAGQPFFVVGFLLTSFSPQILFFGSRWLRNSPSDLRWAFVVLALSIVVGAVFIAVGVWRTIRFRRENPIPEEWRQIPRIKTPFVPGRTPPPPGQG